MNATKGKQMYGQIRPGQYWQKRDNKMIMSIVCKQKGDTWRVVFTTRSMNASHKIKEQVIYKYYDRL